MSYSYIPVAVATTFESQQLLDKVVFVIRPANARISLIILALSPELYNQLAAPVLEDLREAMQEETQDLIDELNKEAEYLTEHTLITHRVLNGHILDVCRRHAVDLAIYGNHNHNFFLRAFCSAKSVIHTSQVDALLVPLAGD